MSGEINPYRLWLGLDGDQAPDYYGLLGLARDERDIDRIARAAERAMARVRSCRPGSHQEQWSQLLDELAAAKRCLTDVAQRAAYDRQFESAEFWPPARKAQPADGADEQRPREEADAANQETVEQIAPAIPRAFLVPPAVAWGGSRHTSRGSFAAPSARMPVHGPPTESARAQPTKGTELPPELDEPAPPANIPGAEPPLPSHLSAQTFSQGVADSTDPAALYDDTSSAWSTLIPLFLGVVLGLGALTGLVWWRQQNTSQADSGDRFERPPPSSSQPMGELNAEPRPDPQPPRKTQTSDRPPSDDFVQTAASPDDRQDFDDDAPPPLADKDAKATGGRAGVETTTKVEPSPAPEPAPSPEDSAEFKRLLASTRKTIEERQWPQAAELMDQARPLAREENQRAMLRRLETLADLAHEFYAAVEQARAQLSAGSEIAISASTRVIVVESTSEMLVVRVAGMTLEYATDDLPPGLTVALAAQALGADNPRLELLKGVFWVIEGQHETHRVREIWEAAAAVLPEVSDLLPLLDDRDRGQETGVR